MWDARRNVPVLSRADDVCVKIVFRFVSEAVNIRGNILLDSFASIVYNKG
jgi:hypothetical protein